MSCPLIANLDVVRLTRLDSCGRPVCGADNSIAFDCLSSLAMNVNSEDGTDVEYKAANGKVCGFKRGCPTFRGYDIELNFYGVSPEILEITTGNPVVFGYDGTPIGYDDCDIQCDTGFAIEGWAEVLGEDVCVTDGLATGQWIYFLLPWVTNGLLGDIEVGSEAVTLTMQGSTRSGGGWGVGPYNVLEQNALLTPGPLLTPLGSTCHRRIITTRIAPPTADCEYADVTEGLCLAS